MRTFIEKYLHFMKNCIRPHCEELKLLKSGFIENSIFENNRDPWRNVKEFHKILYSSDRSDFQGLTSCQISLEISSPSSPSSIYSSSCSYILAASVALHGQANNPLTKEAIAPDCSLSCPPLHSPWYYLPLQHNCSSGLHHWLSYFRSSQVSTRIQPQN